MTGTVDDILLLNALADGELDAAASLALETRLRTEPALAADYARIAAMKAAVSTLPRPIVTSDFYARMAAMASPKSAWRPARTRTSAGWIVSDWRAIAASLVLTAFLASTSTYLLTTPPTDVAVEDAVIAGHRRSLLAASPVDVVSSDRHTVRPWFDAKLGVAPPTPDLSGAGFPLVGGRVEVVAGKAVPTIVYRHDAHLITVVAIPDSSSTTTLRPPKSVATNGYNVARWDRGGFTFWAVSDLDPAELDNFVAALGSK